MAFALLRSEFVKLQMGQVESYLAQQLQADVQILQVQKLGTPSNEQATSTLLLAPEIFHGNFHGRFHESFPDKGQASDIDLLKTFSYGHPILISCLVNDCYKRFVLRTVAMNEFDHQRRSDRASKILLDYDTFNELPHHARAFDVGMVTQDHRLVSIAESNEFFLLTEYVRGQPYASDLQRLCKSGEVTGVDLTRARQLALYLAKIHAVRGTDATLYTRRIREMLYGGEGIMGLADSYTQAQQFHTQQNMQSDPSNRTIALNSAAKKSEKQIATLGSPEWFEALEQRSVTWRWRLRQKSNRLAQIHGDFHPFSVLFEHNNTLHTIDRSRGAWGDPADDVASMAINYLFFSLQRSDMLASPFEQLWNIFWNTYLGLCNDPELLLIIGPFFAWRALVLASPIWYKVGDAVRTKLLTFAKRVLEEDFFDPAAVNSYL